MVPKILGISGGVLQAKKSPKRPSLDHGPNFKLFSKEALNLPQITQHPKIKSEFKSMRTTFNNSNF